MTTNQGGPRVDSNLSEASRFLGCDVLANVIYPYTDELRENFGEKYEPLLRYLKYAGGRWRAQVKLFADAIKADPAKRTLIVCGERGFPEDADAREHEPFHAVIEACRRLEGTPFHILFTGGCMSLRHLYGEVPAMPLAEAFMGLTDGTWDDLISVDQFSLNTGHQGRLIGNIVRTMGFSRVVIVLPVEHAARFGATVGYDLFQHETSPTGPKTSIFFFPTGNWDEMIPRRDMTRAQEAFGPIQSPTEAILPSKALGGEITYRLATEIDPVKSKGYACPALPPDKMLEFFMPYAQ